MRADDVARHYRPQRCHRAFTVGGDEQRQRALPKQRVRSREVNERGLLVRQLDPALRVEGDYCIGRSLHHTAIEGLAGAQRLLRSSKRGINRAR